MRVVQKTIKFGTITNKLYYEQFGSYEEYLRIVENRQNTNAHSYRYSFDNVKNRSSITGCSSYQEAKDLLTKGWDAKVEYIKECVDKEVNMLDTKRVVKQFSDVAGFMPIVPMAVMNLPVCMINAKQGTKKQKVVKFMIIMNRSSRFSSYEIIEKMSKVLARISILEKNGYRCRIEAFGSFHEGDYSGKTIVCHSVLIKSENQLFDIKRMAFPIAHPSFQKVFGWGWENSLPIDYESYHFDDLGRSVLYWDKTRRDDLLNALSESNEKVIFLGMETDIEKELGKVVV